MKPTTQSLILAATLACGAFTVFTPALAEKHGKGPVGTSELDSAEADTLTFIREEEKMARDVYLTMEATWGMQIFENIADSEQEHMDSIKSMLDKYGLPDPAQGIGDFLDGAIQDLYDLLVASGELSELDALYAGAFIEEFDIADLRLAIEETDNADLQQVYGNLEEGSENHLRAFVGEIQSRGITYEAQYLDQSTVDDILAADSNSGRP